MLQNQNVKADVVTTKPAWSADQEGRVLYESSTGKLWYAGNAAWIDATTTDASGINLADLGTKNLVDLDTRILSNLTDMTQDIADALSGSAAPASGNVFATIADIAAAGGAIEAKMVGGAVGATPLQVTMTPPYPTDAVAIGFATGTVTAVGGPHTFGVNLGGNSSAMSGLNGESVTACSTIYYSGSITLFMSFLGAGQVSGSGVIVAMGF